MIVAFQILALFLVAIAMGLSLAHALEFPGKLRLARAEYQAVQPIYYPGFTIGGMIGEFGGMVALASLLFVLPGVTFWYAVVALAFMLASHAIYWLVTHPTNNFWLKDTNLSAPGGLFFSVGPKAGATDWKRLRNIWEYSHIGRAILFAAAFLATAISIAN